MPSGSIALPSVPPNKGLKTLAMPVSRLGESPGATTFTLPDLGWLWYPQAANISEACKFICLSIPNLLICEQSKGSDGAVASEERSEAEPAAWGCDAVTAGTPAITLLADMLM